MQIFLSFCIPCPQGSTCPPAVHCWQLDFTGPWWTVVGTMSLKTFCLAYLSLCDFGRGFACEQEESQPGGQKSVLLHVQGGRRGQ